MPHAPTKTPWLTTAAIALGCAILGASLSLAVVGAPQAAAQGRQRYEYKVLTLEYSVYREQDEWKAILQANNNDAWVSVGPFHEAILNSWASEGWVLEHMNERKRGSTLIYMRRAKR